MARGAGRSGLTGREAILSFACDMTSDQAARDDVFFLFTLSLLSKSQPEEFVPLERIEKATRIERPKGEGHAAWPIAQRLAFEKLIEYPADGVLSYRLTDKGRRAVEKALAA